MLLSVIKILGFNFILQEINTPWDSLKKRGLLRSHVLFNVMKKKARIKSNQSSCRQGQHW